MTNKEKRKLLEAVEARMWSFLSLSDHYSFQSVRHMLTCLEIISVLKDEIHDQED